MRNQIVKLNKTQAIVFRQGCNPWLVQENSETDEAEFIAELTEKQALELIKNKHTQENLRTFSTGGGV